MTTSRGEMGRRGRNFLRTARKSRVSLLFKKRKKEYQLIPTEKKKGPEGGVPKKKKKPWGRWWPQRSVLGVRKNPACVWEEGGIGDG